jgi:hypothetical protein
MVLHNFSRSILRQSANKCVASRFNGAVTRSMSASPWADFEMAPADPIIGLNEAYMKDDFPHKVIVGVGAYRDDAGKPYVLPCVRKAEKLLMDKGLDMEYAGIVSAIISVDYWKLCALLEVPKKLTLACVFNHLFLL